ncbi:hypothetical protein Tco_0713269 [Tanacetum coccineum]
MSRRFYYLNRVDDVNLKQVFLNSFPKSLGNEAYRALEARNVTIAQTTLSELYQLILNALAKLCNQKKFLAEFERTAKRLGTTCDDKYMQIKCKDKSSCNCTHKKKIQVSLVNSGFPDEAARSGNLQERRNNVAEHLTGASFAKKKVILQEICHIVD